MSMPVVQLGSTVISKVSGEIDKLGDVLHDIQMRIDKLEATGTSLVLQKEAGVVDRLENRIVRIIN